MNLKTKSSHNVHANGNKRFAAVDSIMEQFNYEAHCLVEVLFTAQEAFGFLSKDLLIYVSKKLNIPLSRVYGVATFYDRFKFDPPKTTEYLVCTGPACTIAGAEDVLSEVCNHTGVPEPGQNSADGKHKVNQVSCLGLCDQAPAALVGEQAQVNISYIDMATLLQGKAKRPCIQVSGNPREITGMIGVLDPTDLDAHMSKGAFTALDTVLNHMTPEQVIAEIKDSRLTGRGGAGFSTGLKWEFARKAEGRPKYVVCNFDESEPGTFKDRVLMEGDPFRVIEGLMISAYVLNSTTGYIFIRGEYPTASSVIQDALDELYLEGLLGEDILDTGFSFDVEVRHNAGAYICGEETALFEAIEGKRGYPRHKPPYPTQFGLFGEPTAINNVETLAVVPSLILQGGEWFRQWGTNVSVGLKLFCLSGNIKQPGVVEAPFGLTVRELIEEFGGGFEGEPQAVLIGGAAGGFLHPDKLDTRLTHEDLGALDVPIGSGALMVFNQSVDLWKILEGLARFFVHECCGQCSPCRLGTNQIYKLLCKINEGAGNPIDILKAEKLGKLIKNTCLCGLGMTAANPLLTYLRNFEVGF